MRRKTQRWQSFGRSLERSRSGGGTFTNSPTTSVSTLLFLVYRALIRQPDQSSCFVEFKLAIPIISVWQYDSFCCLTKTKTFSSKTLLSSSFHHRLLYHCNLLSYVTVTYSPFTSKLVEWNIFRTFISVFNQLDAQNLFHNKFYFMPLHVSSHL